MTRRVELSCDQPDCLVSLKTSEEQVKSALTHGGWKTEELESGTFHTCPNHGENAFSVEVQQLASASLALLYAIKRLDQAGYYPVQDDDALVVFSYEKGEEGPRAVISQLGHSFRIHLAAPDGTVLADEESEVWL